MTHVIYQRLQQHAQQQPNAIALREPQRTFTYRELFAAVNEQMDTFKRSAVQRIALDLPNGINWVVNDLALLFNSLVSIPVPPFFTAEQQRKLLADSGAEVLINNSQSAPPWQSLAPKQLPELPHGTVKITYTSGSTGEPKGVCLSSDNIVTTVLALDDRLGQIDVQRHLCVMPLAVLLENIAGLYLSLWRGYEVVLASTDVQQVVTNLRQYQPQSIIATPGLVSAIIQATEQGALNPSPFKIIAVGGARLLPSIEQRAAELNLPLLQGYGLSEFCSVVSFNAPGDTPPVGSVGRALKHAQLRIKRGEIVVQGNAMLGYVHDRSSWYPEHINTGDWGHIDAQGYVFVNGRKKNTMITPFGRNVDPQWLEAELTTMPEIMQAAVFGGENLPITALIVASNGATNVATNVATNLKTTSAAHKQLAQAVAEVNSRLPEYAQICRWQVISEPFSVANQMLTGTGRNRRDRIAHTYSQLMTPTHEVKTMNFFHQLVQATQAEQQYLLSAPVIQHALQGTINLPLYQAFLQQAYHHVKHTTPLLMRAGSRISHSDEWLRKAIIDYINEEYGHEQWILNDLAATGANADQAKHSQPHASTAAMVSVVYGNIDNLNAAAFFGMAHVLEGTSVQLASQAAAKLQTSLQLPKKAFSYLNSHGALDLEHVAFFEQLMNRIDDPAMQQAIVTTAKQVYRLYGDMFRALTELAQVYTTSAEVAHA